MAVRVLLQRARLFLLRSIRESSKNVQVCTCQGQIGMAVMAVTEMSKIILVEVKSEWQLWQLQK